MFDFAWTEIALIGIVALIAIGPKDMPVAIRAISGAIKKARRMAGEFQTHVDEMVREANLDEVRTQFSELRNFNLKGVVEKHVDPDGELRSNFASNPLTTPAGPPAAPPEPPSSTGSLADQIGATAVAERRRPVLDRPAFMTQTIDPRVFGTQTPREPAPAFIPPGIAAPPPRPAFIPPGAPGPRD